MTPAKAKTHLGSNVAALLVIAVLIGVVTGFPAIAFRHLLSGAIEPFRGDPSGLMAKMEKSPYTHSPVLDRKVNPAGIISLTGLEPILAGTKGLF